MPYIASRLNFDGTAITSTPAIPHNPMPEADGTGQLIDYGSSPIICRLDGHGNGGRARPPFPCPSKRQMIGLDP